MHAEILSIGDELTSGARLDTNSQWLSRRLGELGIPVRYQTTVADDLEANIQVFRTAIQRADLVISSGGLGPTADDLTREAIARATARQLTRSDAALAAVRARFRSRAQDMPVSNEVQALLPEGSRMVRNPHGTAPGIAMDIARPAGPVCHLFALPGVPSELYEMWEDSVRDTIAEWHVTGQVIRQYQVKCFGAGESRIEQMLPDLVRRGRQPAVGITASESTISLRIVATAPTEAACEQALQPTIQTIHQCLGDLVFGTQNDELQDAVARLLEQARLTLATIECGTGGLLAQWLTTVAGAGRDRYLHGEVIAAPASMPAGRPGDDLDLGGVSPAPHRLVESWANECRARTGADVALATGPLARAAKGDRPAAPFCVAVATATGVLARQYRDLGPPAMARVRSAKQALNVVRLALLDQLRPPSFPAAGGTSRG